MQLFKDHDNSRQLFYDKIIENTKLEVLKYETIIWGASNDVGKSNTHLGPDDYRPNILLWSRILR